MKFLKRIYPQVIYYSRTRNRILKNKFGLIVLMYHAIHEGSVSTLYPYSISVNSFEEQIQYLKEVAEFIDPNNLVDFRKNNVRRSKLNILLTFDDGYKNNYSLAFPLLRKCQIPGIIFLTTDFIGRDYTTFLNWSEVKEMEKSGLITFGSHCCRHFNLTALDKEDAILEMKNSKIELEKKLGQAVKFLSYPGGGHNREIMNFAEECGYEASFKDRMHSDRQNNKLHAIGRLSVEQTNEDLYKFIATLAVVKPIQNIVRS
ncbi:MAG: polysaccharide deacetylase family protein [Candidatus Hodarchaeota archaeon]